MKTAKEWYDTTEAQLETIRAIQADALEAAALRCAGIAYLHHHEHDECEGRDAANACAAEVRKLLETL